MNDELDPNARRVLDDLRGFENPNQQDRARNRQGLALKIGVGAAGLMVSAKLAQGAGGAAVASAKFNLAKLMIFAIMATAVGGGVGLGVLKARARQAEALVAKAALARQAVPVFSQPAVVPAQPDPVPVEVAPPIQRPREKERVARPRPAATESVVVPPSSQLAEETAILATAREALRRGQAGAALARLDSYVNRFPDGVLREEHAATRILVLAELDRRDEACREVQSFRRNWPRSPLLTKVATACDPSLKP